MILRLTDGTDTVSLVGGTIYRVEYVPRGPKLSTVEYEPGPTADGGEVAAIARPNVVESCRISAVEDTGDNLRTTLQSVEALFEAAIEYQNRRGASRVYVEFAAEDDDDVYRSEILYGTMEPGLDTLSLWADAAVEATLTWKRRFYWEGPEAELSLDNTHGSGTGGVTVYNHYDAVHENFVDITGTDVEGVLLAPVRLEIENTYNDSARLYNVFVGHNVYADPSDLDTILEGQDADSPAGAGTGDADCSGGKYKATSTLAAAQANVMEWDLSSSLLGHCNGRWFRLLMRLKDKDTTSGTDIQPKILFAVTPVSEGEEVRLNSSHELQDLGVVQLPPWLQGMDADLYSVTLALYGRRASATGSLDVDFVQLTPMDGYRVLKPRGYGCSFGIRLVDDAIGGWLWTDGWSGDQRTGHYYGEGQPLQLVPGKNQRLYFLMTNSSSGCEIVRTASVRVYYRPRRVAM